MTLENKKQFLKKNSIIITALFILILGSLVSLSLQQSKQDEPSYVIINESGNGTGVTGDGVNGRVTFWNGTSSITSDAELLYNSGTNILSIIILGSLTDPDIADTGVIRLAETDPICWGTASGFDKCIKTTPLGNIIIQIPTGTTEYQFGSDQLALLNNSITGISFLQDNSVDQADTGFIRVGNNIDFLCAESSPTGLDNCIKVDTNENLLYNGNEICDISGNCPSSGGLTQAYVRVQDEGTNQTQRFILNCIGTGIICNDDSANNRTNLTITTSGNITGSGTANRIPKFNTAIDIRDSNAEDDGTNWNFLSAITNIDLNSNPILDFVAGSIMDIAGNTIDNIGILIDNSADPADTGTIRLGFDQCISWESSPTGTDRCFNIAGSDFKILLSSPTNNQILKFNSTSAKWENESEPALRRFAAHWNKQVVLTNVGTPYLEVYKSASEIGMAVEMDTTGKTQVKLDLVWDKIGTGTQSIRLISCTPSATNCDTTSGTVLIEIVGLVDGYNISTVSIPSSLLNTVKYYQLEAKSTTAADDPIFLQAVVTFL
jgi:hypothetical protein